LLKERIITVEDIKKFHHLFFNKIDADNAGVWRDVNIVVTGSDYEFPSPDELEQLMIELGQWIETERDKMHPVRFAAMLHLKFVTVHPFIDGNGRVSRLIMNTSLIQDGYMIALIPPVIRHDYMTSIRLYQMKSDAAPFCDLIADRVLESEKEIMRLLKIPPPL
jgi:Fic family protein